MRTHVRKWGNSLALRLPRTLAADAGLEEGSAVDLTLDRGRLVAAPVRETRVALRVLLSRVRPAQLHDATDWGPRAGREAW